MHVLNELLNLTDLWTYLQSSDRAIVLYGMGDGADKILNVCLEKNIKICGVFASDGFVRNKIFRGFNVTSLSEIKSKYKSPIILVSFASSLTEVMDNIYRISLSDELYAPDVPVFGGGIFDKDFFKNNFESFCSVYDLLSDDISKKVYYNILKYKITGNINYLKECETDVSESYSSIIKPKSGSVYVDIGAYNGDTIKEYLTFAENVSKIYAFEPDERNYKKLIANATDMGIDSSSFYNIAAWNEKTLLTFYSRSGRNSANTSSHIGLKAKNVSADCADNYISQKVDHINIDAEGSDLKVIEGLEGTLRKYKPSLSCAIYHRNEDMFEIPLKLAEIYGQFKLYARHFPYIPAWDTNIYITSD